MNKTNEKFLNKVMQMTDQELDQTYNKIRQILINTCDKETQDLIGQFQIMTCELYKRGPNDKKD